MNRILKFILSIFICISAGIIGLPFNINAIGTWYVYLNKPFFSPPNWIFGPMWTVLYILMGISLFSIWSKKLNREKLVEALKPFFIQLALNAAWSPVFFGLKNILLALVIIIVMLFYIRQTIIAFRKLDKTAAYLLYPYFAWVLFATFLNASIWVLNK